MECEDDRVTTEPRPGNGREWVSRPVGWPPSLPFVLHTSLLLSITRALYAWHSEDKVTHLSQMTADKSLFSTSDLPKPAYQPSRTLAPAPQHAHCGHLIPEMATALLLKELSLPGDLLGAGKHASPGAANGERRSEPPTGQPIREGGGAGAKLGVWGGPRGKENAPREGEESREKSTPNLISGTVLDKALLCSKYMCSNDHLCSSCSSCNWGK